MILTPLIHERRKTGALSWLLFTGAAVTTESTVAGAKFVNAKPVYFPNVAAPAPGALRGGFGFGYVRPAPRPAGATPTAPPAPQPPITLIRNGKEFKITANQSTVRAGTEIQVLTERPEVSLSLSEMAKDSWVVFELPGFANANSGKQQSSLDALRKATETSYFKGPDAVWVKLVIPSAPKGMGRDEFVPAGTQASITVSR